MSFREQLCELPDLEAELFRLLSQVSCGELTTYGDLARALGDENARAARWVGEILKSHAHSQACPCHRVLRVNGEIGHFVTGDPQQKAALLTSEGVIVSVTGVADLSSRRTEFRSSRPLNSLKEFQLELVKQSQFPDNKLNPQTVAGVDLAYPQAGQGVGVYVELDASSGSITFEKRIQVPVTFPYLPGFLSFRELPVLLELFDQVRSERDLAEVIFVDGNGILHPWRAGIATCLGVLISRPTIGVGKSLLCGSVELREMSAIDDRPIMHNSERIGMAMKTNNFSKPVYVSPGNLISIDEARNLARRFMSVHRLPEPVYLADRLTKTSKCPLDI